jgi:hypothetical protein
MIMKSEEISKELERLEKNKAALISQMDALYYKMREAMPEVAASWMNKEVERRIKENPERVQALGIDKVKKLKSKLQTLLKELPEVVKAEFGEQNEWPSHSELVQEFAKTIEEGEYIDRVFRKVISKLGGLLNEFQLMGDQGGLYSSWKSIGRNEFRYEINPGPLNLPGLKDYEMLHKQYLGVSEEIATKRKSLSEAKAKELWDQA